MAEHSLTGLGSLFILPQELRDLIYGYVFCGETYTYIPKDRPSGLLMASKVLGHEALDIFYAQCRFRFDLLRLASSHRPGSRLSNSLANGAQDIGPSLEVFDRLDDVEISIDMSYFKRAQRPPLALGEKRRYMDLSYKTILMKLSNTKRVRKTCYITLHNHLPGRLRSVEELRELRGFQKVILKSECIGSPFLNMNTLYRPSLAREARLRKELQTDLEETLGRGQYYEEDNTLYLEFHPQSKHV